MVKKFSDVKFLDINEKLLTLVEKFFLTPEMATKGDSEAVILFDMSVVHGLLTGSILFCSTFSMFEQIKLE